MTKKSKTGARRGRHANPPKDSSVTLFSVKQNGIADIKLPRSLMKMECIQRLHNNLHTDALEDIEDLGHGSRAEKRHFAYPVDVVEIHDRNGEHTVPVTLTVYRIEDYRKSKLAGEDKNAIYMALDADYLLDNNITQIPTPIGLATILD